MRPRKSAQSGFTLAELMVVIAVLAILAAIGIPSMMAMRANSDLRASVEEFHLALTRARSEAMTAQVPVIFCPSSEPMTCGAWADANGRYLMFRDDNGDASISSDDQIIAAQQQMPPEHVAIQVRGPAAIRFVSSGHTNANVAIAMASELANIGARSICTERAGRVNVMQASECPHEE